jgi:hypothetical protein
MRTGWLLVLVAFLAWTANASAQFGRGAGAMLGPPQPPQYGLNYRPNLSPYLNLLRGGDPAANFFLGTVPEFQRRSDAIQTQSRFRELDEQLRPDGPLLSGTAPIPNSTQRYFNNTGGYFPPVRLPQR